MKPLILTSLNGVGLKDSGRADLVVPFCFNFAWGQLPSPEWLAAYLGPSLPEQKPGDHWSCYITGRWPPGQKDRQHLSVAKDRQHLSLVEFCRPYESVELWFGPDLEDQLQLIWLLDGLRSDPETIPKLKVRLVSYEMVTATPKQLAQWHAPAFDVASVDLDVASITWQAYRASTPEAFCGLLRRDLGLFLMLRPVVADLVEELPSVVTGLGATEMRLLELVAGGYTHTNALFHLRSLTRRRVFDSWRIGFLLEGLAHGPEPVIAGLDDEIRAIPRERHYERDDAYKRSRLTITDFGRAVLFYKEDFSRHNPIDRWWGGTHLTNDNLWRYDRVLIPPKRQ